jgi:hydrogenase expression/formation protein HypD
MISAPVTDTAQKLLDAIARISLSLGPVSIMEVCGTHTHEIGRLGLRSLLPRTIKLISGPGCPVCVTPGAVIDAAASLALEKSAIIATFGDMVRVPGNKTSLAAARAAGGQVEVVASPLDTLRIAGENPGKEAIFVAVGFETTIPSIARAIELAHKSRLPNISFITSLKLVPPALDALCADSEIGISGFMLPGHVSAIIGENAYGVLERRRVPGVITGFESLDILGGILELLVLIRDKKAVVGNAYRRTVPPDGNPLARELMNRIFEPIDAEFRGIGVIPKAGLAIRKQFGQFDAEKKFGLDMQPGAMPAGCSCGEVLKGKITPKQCPLFGTACTPENPCGPCMVSSEGSCAAYFKYER